MEVNLVEELIDYQRLNRKFLKEVMVMWDEKGSYPEFITRWVLLLWKGYAGLN